jgi:ubiquinone/menaquinone biosynthesis C-methylase UbiE
MVFNPRTAYQDIGEARRYDHDRFGSLSGRLFQLAEGYALRRIGRRLPGGAVILDAPCGTGRLMPIFIRLGLVPIGGDISGAMLRVARERVAASHAQERFSLMDLIRIPLADESVDAVFSIRFLPHIAPAERVLMLQEFGRITRRWVVISLSFSSPLHRMRRRIRALFRRGARTVLVGYPADNRAIATQLRQAGLHEVRRLWTVPVLSGQLLLVCVKTQAGA